MWLRHFERTPVLSVLFRLERGPGPRKSQGQRSLVGYIALWGGREGCCKQITLVCARSASATLGLPPLTARVTSLPTLLGL